ncbi:MAG: hypothetical protein MZV64_59195 [Ignavibacteriales bacterium]|nr:hypothetical protein [Ignavibacteriales bacterium]
MRSAASSFGSISSPRLTKSSRSPSSSCKVLHLSLLFLAVRTPHRHRLHQDHLALEVVDGERFARLRHSSMNTEYHAGASIIASSDMVSSAIASSFDSFMASSSMASSCGSSMDSSVGFSSIIASSGFSIVSVERPAAGAEMTKVNTSRIMNSLF